MSDVHKQAHDMLLDTYRVWIADDREAHPKPDTELAELLDALNEAREVGTSDYWRMRAEQAEGALALNENAIIEQRILSTLLKEGGR